MASSVSISGEPIYTQTVMASETYERMPPLLNGRNASVHTTHGQYPKVDVMADSSTENTGQWHLPFLAFFYAC